MSKKKVIPTKCIKDLTAMIVRVDELSKFYGELKEMKYRDAQLFVTLGGGPNEVFTDEIKEDITDYLIRRIWQEMCNLELEVKAFVANDLHELLNPNGNT